MDLHMYDVPWETCPFPEYLQDSISLIPHGNSRKKPGITLAKLGLSFRNCNMEMRMLRFGVEKYMRAPCYRA